MLLGASVSPKSTLLNILGALDTPTEGSIEVGGKRVYTQVVDRAPVPAREDFALTTALGDRLGLPSGTAAVRWAFAR